MITIVGELFVVGRMRDADEPSLGWDFVGAYTDYELAEDACRDALDFVCTMPIDPPVPTTEVDAFFPHAEGSSDEDDSE